MSDTPRIYVACLASYNNGILHGRWIDCDQSGDEIREEVNAMLAESTQPVAEEWAIHASEGWGEYSVNEYDDFDMLADLAAGIDQHGEVFAAWFANSNADTPEVCQFEEQYRGEYDSLDHYVEDFWDQCGYEGASNWWHPSNYVDWERMGNDLKMSGDIWTHEDDCGKVHVFDNC